jgi:hypothetical protein
MLAYNHDTIADRYVNSDEYLNVSDVAEKAVQECYETLLRALFPRLFCFVTLTFLARVS